jgi:hypothetical protein
MRLGFHNIALDCIPEGYYMRLDGSGRPEDAFAQSQRQ